MQITQSWEDPISPFYRLFHPQEVQTPPRFDDPFSPLYRLANPKEYMSNAIRISGPTRLMDRSELSDRLRALKRVRTLFGSDLTVPMLSFSNYIPEYVETTADGVEVYTGGKMVPPGWVIDTHGNIVNLRAIEEQLLIIKLDTSEESSGRRYDPHAIVPAKGLLDPERDRAIAKLILFINRKEQ